MQIDKNIEKYCPPSDKRINLLVWLGSLLSIVSAVSYVLISFLFSKELDDNAENLLKYLFLIPITTIIVVGMYFSIFQLLRNRYQTIINSIILYSVCAVLITVYLIIVGANNGVIPTFS